MAATTSPPAERADPIESPHERAPSGRGAALEARLNELFERLRERGYVVSADQRADAVRLLADEVARHGDDLGRLGLRLAPIFAFDAPSQAELRALVDAVFAGGPAGVPAEEALQDFAARFRRRRRRLRRALLAAVVCTAVAATGYTAYERWTPPVDPPVDSPPPAITSPAEDPGPIPPDPRVEIEPGREVEVGRAVPHPWRPWVAVASGAVPLLAFVAWALWRRREQRRWLMAASRTRDAPDAGLAADYAARSIPPTPSVRRAARNLQSPFQAQAPRLDLDRSIRATARAAGFFTPVHRRGGAAADYVVLVERRSVYDHLARMADAILDQIEAAGVRLVRFDYEDDPRLCRVPDGGPLVRLADIGARYGEHRFLVIGTSEGFFHPLTGELMAWTRAFATLTSRTLLNARPPRAWSYREDDLLGLGFALGTASPQGVAAFGDAVATGRLGEGGVILDGRMRTRPTWPEDRPPLSVFRDIDAPWCPEMVAIPAGRFLMGSPPDEPGRSDDEGPQHEVTVPAFALGRYPVTFDEYERFCAETRREPPPDQGWGRGRRPVINVSFEDARAYVAWLAETSGRPCRLPSEAEWEYACRAGTTTRYAFGDDISPLQANYQSKLDKTTEVGSYAANAWGLADMHGNVREWVEDCWHENYEGAPDDGSIWLGANGGDCSRRVVRSGSWINQPESLRSASRNRNLRHLRYLNLGFRVARTLTP